MSLMLLSLSAKVNELAPKSFFEYNAVIWNQKYLKYLMEE